MIKKALSSMSRSIALLQGDSTVGDLQGNAKRLEALAELAASHGAVLGLSTELAICGYPPRDLLLQSDFVLKAQSKASDLSVSIPVLVGTPLAPEHEKQLPSNVLFGAVQLHPRRPMELELLPKSSCFQPTMCSTKPDISSPIIGQELHGRSLVLIWG